MAPVLRAADRLGVTARAMNDADLPFVAALYASTRAEELALTGWSDTQRAAFLDQQHCAQHHHYQNHYPGLQWLILEQDGAAIGRLYLVEWAREFRVVDISLSASHRGQGVGGAIIADVLAAAAAAGKAVSIHAEKANAARRLYFRLGFAVVADKGVYELLEWQPPGTALSA
jgi:GNAT superfamily N-acetyltransferase